MRFTNKAWQGVKIEAPWVIEANGALRTDAVHWELDTAKSGSGPQRLPLVVAAGLRYPVVVDPSWTATGSLGTAIHASRRGKALRLCKVRLYPRPRAGPRKRS